MGVSRYSLDTRDKPQYRNNILFVTINVFSLTKVIYVLKHTEQYQTLNPMQQVPAVEIDGITLSQSVSPQMLYLQYVIL